MAIQTPIDYIQVGGKVDVLIALPHYSYQAPYTNFSPRTPGVAAAPTTGSAAYAFLWKLGELEDEVEPRFRNMMHRVPGDRHGGSAGDAMEMQFMGQMAEIDIALSRWDKEIFTLLSKLGGLTYDTYGNQAIPQNTTNAIRLTDIGAFVMRDRSFRLLLYPNRDSSFVMNFPCCLLESDFGSNVSTKYSRLSMRITAHRTPEGHWSSSGATWGVLVNADTTGAVAQT